VKDDVDDERKIKIKLGDKNDAGHVANRLTAILRGLADGDGSALSQLAETLGADADVNLEVETDDDGNTTRATLKVTKESSSTAQAGKTEAADQGFDFAIPTRRRFPYTEE
jgi:hypothetical protein